MRLFGVILSALVVNLGALALATDPIPKSDGKVEPRPVIKFNDVTPPSPAPSPGPMPAPPAPDPAAVQVLNADSLYVALQSDTPFLLFASPSNLVTITKESGPLKVRGRFSDGAGKYETRVLTAKYLAIVEAAGTGRVELIAVPVGADAEGVAVRKMLDVNDGTKPIPPPKPVDPKVDPVPPKPVPVGDFRVLFVYETSASLTREQLNILNSTAIRTYLNSKCVKDSDGRPGWRSWDVDISADKDLKVWRDLWAATKPKLGKLPQAVIVIGTEGTVFPLPETEAATLELLKKYGDR